MDKLVEFLEKEVPESANQLFEIINDAIVVINNTTTLINKNTLKLLEENKHDEITPYIEASKDLGQLSSYLSKFIDNVSNEKIMDQNVSKSERKEDSYKTEKDFYIVDESEPHGLFENFTYKRPKAFTLEGKKYPVRDWKQLLWMTCEVLNARNPQLFESFTKKTNMQGNSRKYFSFTDTGMYNPQKIAGSNIYVETNHSANGICNVIADMLEQYNIAIDSVKIYLIKDYTSRHEKGLKKN